jgi:hypothetical protein
MPDPVAVLLRLLAALGLGSVVAWIHARTSKGAEMGASFPATLVLLAVLIAMVTQVIGDNVARAFSLVGALSIVRFRTVVRDTRDTAFVIFAVVVGMAAGAQNLWVGGLGLAVGGAAAFALSALAKDAAPDSWTPEHVLTVRAAMAVRLEKSVGGVLDERGVRYRVLSIGTVKMATGMEGAWQIAGAPAEDLVRELGRIEGIQDVRIERWTGEEK